jgi:secreted trypsin-like serine protease
MITKIISIFLSLIIINSTVAGTKDPNIPDKKYIEYGEKFNYVGRLCGEYQSGENFCASAVAIDDHHILTAAHVVDGSKICFIHINNKKICVNKIISNKDFDYHQYGTADIAIGYCEESIDLDFYPELYTEENEVDKICCISGFGLTGNFLTGAIHSDNKRRAGSNTIDRIDSDLLICSPSKMGSDDYTSLEFLIASGDSGGGLFINNKLAGINSCVMAFGKSPSSKYNEDSGHTRVSKFIEWIRKNQNEKK